MLRLAVIADDLTGANDTALQFARQGMHAFVQLGIEDGFPGDGEVVVVDTDSRELACGEAYRRMHAICRSLRESKPSCIYKKIDSTLRGNWGAEVAAADDALAPSLVVIAPAYPAQGRTTVDGVHLLHGVPIERTEIGHVPKTPVHESDLPAMLAQQAPGKSVTVLPLQTLRAGEEEARKRMAEALAEGRRWIVSDIAEDADFARLLAALRGKGNILWVGSAGLAGSLASFYGWKGSEPKPMPVRDGSVLVFAGSVSHTTQRQIRTLNEMCGVRTLRLSARHILEDEGAAAADAKAIESLVAAGEDVLLASAESDADVAEAVRIGRTHGLSGRAVSERVAAHIAAIAKRLDFAGVAGIVATGGDTAVHICRAMGVQQIEVLREVEPGVPLGRIEGAREPLCIVTKAGAFGSPRAFVHALAAIRGTHVGEKGERKETTA